MGWKEKRYNSPGPNVQYAMVMRIKNQAARKGSLVFFPRGLYFSFSPIFWATTACAAASRAIGTRKGEQET
jgi:hypothetical protein